MRMVRRDSWEHVDWQDVWRRLRGVVLAVLFTWIMFISAPRPGPHGRGAVLAVLIGFADLTWIATLFLSRRPKPRLITATACMFLGVAVLGFAPFSSGLFYVYAPGLVIARRAPWRVVGGVIGAVATAYIAVALLTSDRWALTLGVVLGLALGLLAVMTRRQADERAEQARRLDAEEARTAVLTERTRIAREIHDVLAHTLTALSVQLETIDALLDKDRVGQAQETVRRAQTLMREGLAETRRAISALRDDPLPLPQLLRLLTEAYPSTLEVTGTERPLSPIAGLAVYRTAQEALTNARKHAPGSTVTILLRYREADVTLDVRSTGGTAPTDSTAGRVGGYGLTGLRERAELAGGTFTAGPCPDPGGSDERGWRVSVIIPT